MIDEVLGKVSAYAYAVEKGYTGTEEQFAYDLAHAADYASTAGTAAENASKSERNAKNSEEAATLSEGNAQTYANNAHSDAEAALDAKAQAISAKNDAVSAKGSAENSATIANNAKVAAAQSEQNASRSAESASDDAENASNSANSASVTSLKSEGFAVGEQNGVLVESGSPYYENNSKYYSEQAAAQLTLVTNEGTRQIGLVTDEGTAQKNAVQEKGAEVLESIPADYSELNADVSELKSDFLSVKDFGYLLLTDNDFEQGTYTSSGVKQSGERVIRAKNTYNIKPGDRLITESSTLYMGWYLLDTEGNLLETGFQSSTYRVQITNKTHVFTHTGILYITVANGYNYGNSTTIVPSDMTAVIKVVNDFAINEIEKLKVVDTDLQDEIDYLQDDSTYIFTKIIDENPESSEVAYLYYPYNFIVGNDYIIKIKFASFSSNTNRKYSIRTTTERYISSAYAVQIIKIVEGTAPALDVEYTYRFNATKRQDGGLPKYLALELSVNGVTSAMLEVYSVKGEEALTRVSEIEWVNGTDIVSLNHDVKNKVLNGKKPFNRETTAPLALLHFSDIHAAQTNLTRLVEMGNSLDGVIDNVICTGDMVSNNYSATCMDFWDAVPGAENILLVVGNHDLADGEHGYSSDQIGQATAYAKYFAPYVSNWGVTMAGTNLTYWYKDYAAKKVRLIGLNYLLTGAESTAQKTWLVDRLAEAKTAEYAVVIAEHSPLNSFTQIPCNFNIIGKAWNYNEVLADIQSAVQDFIDGGGEFACYIAGHSHNDFVGYNSNYPNQICIVVTTALTTGLDNDQRRVNGEKSQDAANVVLVDTVTKTVKLVRVGANMDTYVRGRNLFSIKYTDKTLIAQS